MKILFYCVLFLSVSSYAEPLSQLAKTNKKISKEMSELVSYSINSNSISFSQSLIVDKFKVIEGHGVSCILKSSPNSKQQSFIEISAKSKGWVLTQKNFEASIVRSYMAILEDYQKSDKILAKIETQNTIAFEGVDRVDVTCQSRCGYSTAGDCAQAYADSLKTLLHDNGIRGLPSEKIFIGAPSSNIVAPPAQNSGAR